MAFVKEDDLTAASPSVERSYLTDKTLLLATIGACASLLSFFALLGLAGPVAGGESLEWALYLAGGTVVPLLGGLCAFKAGRTASRIEQPDRQLGLTAAGGAVLCLAALGLAKLDVVPGPVGALLAAGGYAAMYLLARSSGLRSRLDWVTIAKRTMLVLVAALAAAFGARFSWAETSAVSAAAALVILGLCLARGRWVARIEGRRGFDWFVLIVLALVIVSFRVPIEAISADFFLAPANELLYGKTLLVDAFGQYGVLTLYLIALIGRGSVPLSYTSLGLLVSVLAAVQYGIVYFLLRRLTGSRMAAFGLTVLLVGLSVYPTAYVAHSHPSVGPVRFLPPYLLLVRRAGGKQGSSPGPLGDALVLGIASIWSAETFVYTLVTLGGIVLFEALRDRRFRSGLGRLALAICGIVAAHGALAVATRAMSGQWPQWGIYFRFLGAYTTGAVGALPVIAWTQWALTAAIFVGSLVALAVLLKFDRQALMGEDAPDWSIVAGLTALGIVTFSYFVGRSHPFALRHLAAPPLILGVFWLTRLQRSREARDGGRSLPVMGMFAVGVLLMASTGAAGLTKNLHLTTLGSLATGRLDDDVEALRHPPVLNIKAGEAAELIGRYAPDKPTVPLLISEAGYTETLMLARKGNFFLVNDPLQDTLLWEEIPDAPRFQRLPGDGDFAFIENPDDMSDLQLAYLKRLEDKFCLTTVATSPTGVQAVRLTEVCPS